MRRPSVPIAFVAALLVAVLAPAPGHAQQATTDVIATVAGSGAAGFGGDAGPATAALLATPSDVAPLSDGGYLIADTANNRIRRVAADGTIATVAGAGGAPGYAGNGLPAVSADVRLNQPRGVAATADGGFLIADTGNHVIRRVSPAGVITTVAGQPTVPGLGGDGDAATGASLNAPQGVAALADGAFLIADTGNNRIRRVAAGGIITTVAGSESAAPAAATGSGIPAATARLIAPARVLALAGGGFLIADTGNNRIRRVDPGGVISTVAGSGIAPGYSGDGGPATAAQLNAPEGIAVRGDGSIVIADTGNQRVRQVDVDGSIRTLAGTGTAGFGGDGGIATDAQLSSPRAVAQGNGRLLVADSANNRIRSIATIPVAAPGPTPTPDPEPPAQAPPGVASPQLGRNAVVAPVSGRVRIRLPGRRGFVDLTAATNVGVGAELDATQGAVAVFFVTNRRGKGASAIASQGRFLLLQPNVRFLGERPGLLALSQRLSGCDSSSRRLRASAAASKKRNRRLKVSARGKIRTKGKYGSAIVLGTQWTIADACPAGRRSSTSVTVDEGVVLVRDFVRHRSIRVPAGRRYVARTRR